MAKNPTTLYYEHKRPFILQPVSSARTRQPIVAKMRTQSYTIFVDKWHWGAINNLSKFKMIVPVVKLVLLAMQRLFHA